MCLYNKIKHERHFGPNKPSNNNNNKKLTEELKNRQKFSKGRKQIW